MPRLLFKKTGNAVWISHLDLMRLFQRAFKRAGLPLTHTQGFNPRPSVSIALPLSVGVDSNCEILDFDLDADSVALEEICPRLNCCLVDGVEVLQAYDGGRKLRDLAYLRCLIKLEYDNGCAEGTVDAISGLFASESVVVEKKTKNGVQDQNIIPMIQSISVQKNADNLVLIDALICCQNPTLNPMQIPAAIERYLPEHKPDHGTCCRMELYDTQRNIFG
jgi:radical SAM-linked protein